MAEDDPRRKNQPLRKRAGFAVAGVCETWRRERSFRTQVAFAVLAGAALIAIRPSAAWWALTGFAICVVLAFELVNTALEALIDHLHPDLHPQIRVVKDMAAGAVLLVVIGAILVAAALLLAAAIGEA